MNDRCIVTFGKGHNFERGVDRLRDNVEKLVGVPFIGFKDYPIGSPTHQESPFAFKFFCIRDVLGMGFKNILWLDSCVIVKNDLFDVFRLMSQMGYFIIRNWHTMGEYCHDKALETLHVTREESLKMPCIQGTNFGLNFNDDRCQKLLGEMIRLSLDGITFPGPYNNANHMASFDYRVAGHRHDQTAMSAVLMRMGMSNWINQYEIWFTHDRKYVKDVESTVTDVRMSNDK